MNAVPYLKASFLASPRLRHAFFTRAGGVSTGLYASLNGGVGSRDAPEAVAENRRRMAATLGVDTLLVPFQIHSADALVVDGPWPERPRLDALVTRTPGLGIAVTGADCGVVLFADADAGVVGCAHSGWKGALGGVLEATLAAMETLGARRARTVVALGPTIGPRSYEVGLEFRDRFTAVDPEYRRFFADGQPGHAMFDLPGFIGHRVARAGVAQFEDLHCDTYADPARFYSYRRSVHQKEGDYGRLVAAIALA